jgi:hypothetical protein
MNTFFKFAAAIVSLVSAQAVLASPAGNWSTTHHDFVTGAYINTTTVCLRKNGSAIEGVMKGTWKESGGVVLRRGYEQGGSAAYADVLTIIDDNNMTGHNQSWPRTSPGEGYWTTVTYTRLSSAC